MRRFIPFGKQALIRPATVQERVSVIKTPDAQKQKSERGTIVALGNDVDKTLLAVGQEVGWRPYSGHEIRVNGETLLVIRQDEIEGRWEDE